MELAAARRRVTEESGRGRPASRAAIVLAALALLAPASAEAHAGRPQPRVCVARSGRLVERPGRCGADQVTLALRPARGASRRARVVATCVNRRGEVRLVSAHGRCRHHEKKLLWSVEPARGREGAPGAEGYPQLLVPFEVGLEAGRTATIVDERGVALSVRCSEFEAFETELLAETEGDGHALLETTTREEETEFGALGSSQYAQAIDRTLAPHAATVVAVVGGGGLEPPRQGFVSGFIENGAESVEIEAYMHGGSTAPLCRASGAYMFFATGAA